MQRTIMWQAIKQVLPDAKKLTVFSIFEKGKWLTENLSVGRIMTHTLCLLVKLWQNLFEIFLLLLLRAPYHLNFAYKSHQYQLYP